MRNKIKRYSTKLIAFLLVISFFGPLGNTTVYADSGSGSGITLSENRLSMTEIKKIEVTVDPSELGYDPGSLKDADLSNLEWYFGDKKLLDWKRVQVHSWFEETPDYSDQPFFKFTKAPYLDGGLIKAEITNDYLFDGDDAAYFRPWYNYNGTYDFKVADTNTNKSVSTPVRLEAYDSYIPYGEMESTVNDILKNKRDGIYVEYAPIGTSEEKRDVPFFIVAKSKGAVDNYLALKERAEKEPAAVKAEIENGTLADYQIPVYINNIHANETPGVDAIWEFTKDITSQEKIGYKDKNGTDTVYLVGDDVLDQVIFLICPTENPDAYNNNGRGNSFGFDLNRDNTYQTQLESRITTQNIAKWDPAILMELHGFLYGSKSQIMVEPCTPPHEPNLEYDLFMKHALDGAYAFGDIAVANSEYKGTKDCPRGYEIPIEDNFDKDKGWMTSDDMSSNYTPTYAQFHGTVGYTVECGELNDASVVMGKYGLLGLTAYLADNKKDVFLTKLDFFDRANKNEESADTEKWFVDVNNNPVKDFRPKNANGKFYPEYYVIPVDPQSQRNPAAAYDMEEYLLRNDVNVEKLTEDVAVDGVTYKKGSFIIDLHQAKRSMANVVLYPGIKVSGWDSLYSEMLTNFPDLRGFDCDEIMKADAFKGKTTALTAAEKGSTVVTEKGSSTVVIANNGLDAICAVNDLLAKGVKVGFVTKGTDAYSAGDFVIEAKDSGSIDSKYRLVETKIADIPEAYVIKEPKVYIDGNTFDNFAMNQQMKFKTASSLDSANVIFGSSEPEGKTIAKIKAGVPYVGAGNDVLGAVKKDLLTTGFDYTVESTDYEALYKVDYSDSLVTASYQADKDNLTYSKGIAYFTAIPAKAKTLVSAQTNDSFYVSGYLNGIENNLKGKAVALDYNADGLNMTVFANSITNKAHQQDDYRYAANAVYAKLLGDKFAASGGSSGGSSSHKKDTPSTPVKPTTPVTPTTPAQPANPSGTSKFTDVDNHWAKKNIDLLVSKGIIKGRTDTSFAPNDTISRAEFMQLLFNMSGTNPNTGKKIEFADVSSSSWYADAVAWGVENGITSGISKEKFSPGTRITRQDMACMLERYIEKVLKKDLAEKQGLSTFGDSDNISDYATKAVERMQKLGIINGMGGNNFAPLNNATRAEAATMLVNLIEE